MVAYTRSAPCISQCHKGQTSSSNGTLTFTGGGATSKTVAVSTIDDTIVEGTEDYTVTLSGQSVGDLGTSQANTAIVDDTTARRPTRHTFDIRV